MIQLPAQSASIPIAPLWPALIAMTGVQALVALALFAPGVLAPQLTMSVADVGLFTTAVFAVGMATSLYGGKFARQFGPCKVAAFCALAVALGMTLATRGDGAALVIAGLCIGLAFGPETPASSTLLSKLATPAQRPLIFSIRQTGNQIGAMLGSLTLPLIALSAPIAGYWLIAGLGILAAIVLRLMSRRYDVLAKGEGKSLDLRGAVTIVWQNPRLRALAFLSLPFSAMQLGLNAFLVTFAVEQLALSPISAGVLLATAQAGGLIGRLFWGLVATKSLSSRTVLAGLGFSMSAAALAMVFGGPLMPPGALGITAFLFGLTASGWNGVFLAEIARLAPPDRVAEVTGAVLTASYAGLLMGPAIITTAAIVGTLSLSYVILAALACAGTLQLLRADHDQT